MKFQWKFVGHTIAREKGLNGDGVVSNWIPRDLRRQRCRPPIRWRGEFLNERRARRSMPKTGPTSGSE